jgi:hypothetical protein
MKWGCRFNKRVILAAPILSARKATKFAARHSDVAALRDFFDAERIVA